MSIAARLALHDPWERYGVEAVACDSPDDESLRRVDRYLRFGNARRGRPTLRNARVYEAARADGLGREIPTDWLLQDIRD